MTSTGFNIGYDGSRASSKVLKPPGGGSSDIFGLGSANYAEENKAKIKQPYTTQDRLFGNLSPPITPAKTQSSVFENGSEVAPRSVKKKFVHRNPITGEEIEIEIDVEKGQKSETGSGDYRNGSDSKIDSGDSENDKQVIDEKNISTQAAVRPIQTCIRVRNPPGGKSSGIF